MERLWAGWRTEYVSSAGEAGPGDDGCVFCRILASDEAGEKTYIVRRDEHCAVVLNAYPYTSGHLMVVPFEHTADFSGLRKETSDELMDVAKRAQGILQEVYRPHGFNLGVNLGQAAGAGVTDHLHLHLLPRWSGDANFMTTVAETRVLPEDLRTTYGRLRGKF